MEIIEDWTIIELKNFLDVTEYKEDAFENFEQEDHSISAVTGKSAGRYGCSKFKPLLFECKNRLEYLLKEKLYPTYHYDRFYYTGSKMDRHVDRPSCEISVSLNISSNLTKDWPLMFDNEGEIIECVTGPGDAILYKGMEVPHWRNKLQGNNKTYVHQLFLHFVRADGHYLEFAYDSAYSAPK